tara:strand:+ start:1211 stop:1384 length:174 start_codon:yes stop_codon:yes gene_type:complete
MCWSIGQKILSLKLSSGGFDEHSPSKIAEGIYQDVLNLDSFELYDSEISVVHKVSRL